jgi:hypothetical protein
VPTYPSFPDLSRAPSFDTSRKLEDGVLRSQKESGYVTTRPRFTRQRRIFSISWKNLSADDVAALDQFESSTLAGGAYAFTIANLYADPGDNIAPVVQPFGQMPGGSIVSSAVQLTKPIEIRDAATKWADGSMRYDATMEVMEQ